MKKFKFRAPAFLLALVMLVSLAAVPVSAAEEKTYTVSANLFCPGELNTQLPGVTAYLTNGSNPLGLDGYPAEPPVTPMTGNASLTVAADGKISVKVPIKNPVFTLQSIGGCSNARITASPRDDRTYEAMDGSDRRQGRITSLTVELLDKSGTYVFTSCKEYPTLLSAEWTVPLTLQVDLTGVEFGDGESAEPVKPVEPPKQPVKKANTDALRATISTAEKAISGAVISGDGTDVEPSRVWVTKNAVDTLKSELGKARASLAAVDQASVDRSNEQLKAALSAFHKNEKSGKKETVEQETDSVLKAGTYTVTCNVWFNKADTGLPLNPHITNPTFPPYNPVLDNAELVVDKEGRGTVTVPVTIQDKIMLVKTLEGLPFQDVKMGESGGIASFAVDLGKISTANTVITKSCAADIEMGDLAMSISGLDKPHSWPATFELNLSGIPCSDGSAMPVVEVEMMDADAASEAMAGAGTALPEEEEEPVEEEPLEEEPEDVPEEGSGSTALILAVVLALIAAAGAVVFVKKRKQ